jgi:DNA-binding GntR family transcriptional regulator
MAEQLREKIKSGEYPAGTVLPSTAQLGAKYDVSASVVKAAISVLRSEGLVVGQQGKGVFVRAATRDVETVSKAGEDPLVSQLEEIQGALRLLSDRMAKLEAAVFPKRS